LLVNAQPARSALALPYSTEMRTQKMLIDVIVDPAEAGPIEAAIDAAGGKLDMILLTHHHSDHIAATEDIRSRYSAPVIGARADRQRLPKLDREVW
jgi:hydroxyacylglutathione hydrolase